MIDVVKLKDYSLALLLMTLSWGTFQIEGLYFFMIFQLLYCFSQLYIHRGKIIFCKTRPINIIFVMMLINEISSIASDLPLSFKQYSAVMTFVLIPSYFTYTYLMNDCAADERFYNVITKWLRIGFFIQLMYIPLQYVAYRFMHIDLNKIIFSDLLHFMSNPSFYRHGIFYPSGFTWHSAVLAPMLVLSYLMFDNVYIKILVLVDTFLCGNATSIIGVLITMLLSFVFNLKRINTNVKKKTVIAALVVFVCVFIFVFFMNGYSYVYEKIKDIVIRVLNATSESSSNAHLSYYLLYGTMFMNNSIISNLFGTGYASSGYSITRINGQYASWRHWVVESDIVDILVSKGIFGFIVYYYFLSVICLRYRKIDYKYSIAIIAIVIMGITYNVQFEYVLFIEMLMIGMGNNNRSIFKRFPNDNLQHF